MINSLEPRRVLHVGMGGILLLACSWYEQWQECAKACKKSSVYETKSREGATVWRLKPGWVLGNQARNQLLTILVELGLTPVSSARCHALPLARKKTPDGIAGYFDGGHG